MRTETIGACTLYLADCREVDLPKIGALVTDPPYPNGAGHFDDGIQAARDICARGIADHSLVFWHETDRPPVGAPLVAVHIWHRTNSNRPDNYEAIFEFHRDGEKRASRVLPFSVIFPGLTGIEASGHPTEKNVGLMRMLVKRTQGTVLDPFVGSGTTGVACVRLGRKFIGIERDPKWFEVACRRIEAATRQPDLFVSQPEPKPVQASLFTGAAE